jgi:hypothetical protein
MLGNKKREVIKKALGKYATFFAMPIRGGCIDAKITWHQRDNLGMIGFDLQKPYGFADLPEFQLEYIACFVDLMVEPIKDLIACKIKEYQQSSSFAPTT